MHGIHLEGLKANKNVNMENRNAVTIFVGEQKVSVAKIHISTILNRPHTLHIHTQLAFVLTQYSSRVWFGLTFAVIRPPRARSFHESIRF